MSLSTKLGTGLRQAKDTAEQMTGSQKVPDTSKWNVEEQLETTLNESGQPVTDQYAFTDGKKLSQNILYQDEADPVEAANKDFSQD
ncbi:hypothetical protein BDV25DRAFT_164481 [Aspergillus avenaceus]|uniref:Uncharacterized protein n=1 Tax=Aspergillus avenaceus TaxID=36643 RepID=A0A5N6TGR4_ASPAV|nr:hypothetical protein BDV25DRAFT_164481 [Aspergillus avenaceus]